MLSFRTFAAGLSLALTLAACSDSTAPGPRQTAEPPDGGSSTPPSQGETGAAPAQIAIHSVPASIDVGQEIIVYATAYDASRRADSTAAITWTSSDPAVASLRAGPSRSTYLLGRAAGTVTLSATAGGVTARVTLEVRDPAKVGPAVHFSVTPSTGRAHVNETIQLRAVITDAAGRAVTGLPIEWSVVDPRVAEVTRVDGYSAFVTGRMVGATTIKARVGDVEMSVGFIVEAPVTEWVSYVALHPRVVRLANAGDTATLVATVHESGGRALAGKEVAWSLKDYSAGYDGVPVTIEIVRTWSVGTQHFMAVRAKAPGIVEVHAASELAIAMSVVAVGDVGPIYLP
jgi:hypothetical protein